LDCGDDRRLITVAGLAVATAAIKAFGPLVFGGRELHPLLARVIPLLAPALLAALVMTETAGGPSGSLVLDARAGGWSWRGWRYGCGRRSTWSYWEPPPRPRYCDSDRGAAPEARGRN